MNDLWIIMLLALMYSVPIKNNDIANYLDNYKKYGDDE